MRERVFIRRAAREGCEGGGGGQIIASDFDLNASDDDARWPNAIRVTKVYVACK